MACIQTPDSQMAPISLKTSEHTVIRDLINTNQFFQHLITPEEQTEMLWVKWCSRTHMSVFRMQTLCRIDYDINWVERHVLIVKD